MPITHRLLAIAVAVMWGLNFLAIHASLRQFPPLFLVALRFAIIAVPAMLLVPRPQVPLRWLVGYGIGFGTLQFIGLYLGMAAGFPTGLASLVLQSSAPFTVVLGALLLRERVSGRLKFGVAVAVIGLTLVGVSRLATGVWWPFLLVLFGGFGWALGNLATRKAAALKPLHLTAWMTVVPPIPMLLLSLLVEGPERIGTALSTAFEPTAVPAWLGLGYTILFGTLAGSGIWVWLMARHPSSQVAPFSMLVPVVGIATGWLALGERPGMLALLGGVLVVGGVLYGARPRVSPSAQPSQTHAETAPVTPIAHTAQAVGGSQPQASGQARGQ